MLLSSLHCAGLRGLRGLSGKMPRVCSINIEYVWIYAPQNGWGRVESERRRKEGKENKLDELRVGAANERPRLPQLLLPASQNVERVAGRVPYAIHVTHPIG